MAIKSKKTARVTEENAKHTQQQNKQNNERKPSKQQKKKRKRHPRRRAFPILLRIIVIAILCAGALLLGAMVGYGILGEGEAKDIFQVETWQHILDIVTKE